MKLQASVFAGALLFACSCAAEDGPRPGGWRDKDVSATPVELGAEQVGRLRFRGGLQLENERWNFGGFSGLEVLEDGQLFAITDNGYWLNAQLEFDEDGTLTGLHGARMAAMRDENGEGFPNKRSGDSEGLAILPDGRFAVSFEQTQTIRIYDLLGAGPEVAAEMGPALDESEQLAPNMGLEALAAGAEGDLVVGAEGGFFRTRVWDAALDADAPSPPAAWYHIRTGYFLVGLDRMPDGRFVALERAYAPSLGARARISVFSAEDLASGRIDPEPLGRLARPLAVDNFEGISAVALPDGGTRIYIISDDNFSDDQRSLLFAFDLIEDAAADDEAEDEAETPAEEAEHE